jgi:hypothetical protein
LKVESNAHTEKAQEKEKVRGAAMTLDLGESNATVAQQVHEKIKAKNSGFNKLTNISKAGIVDKRKK